MGRKGKMTMLTKLRDPVHFTTLTIAVVRAPERVGHWIPNVFLLAIHSGTLAAGRQRMFSVARA